MKIYIGCKIIKAEAMDERVFWEVEKNKVYPDERPDRHGYKVVYSDGYISWSPRAAFENAYREITKNEKEIL